MSSKRYLGGKVISTGAAILLLPLFVLAVSLACNLPLSGLWGGDQGQRVSPTTQAPEGKAAGEEDENSSSASEGQAETPTPSFTPSVTPTITPTPTPYVEISGNTNCRYGPGEVYDRFFTYMAGDEAAVLGKDLDEKYWFVHNDLQSPDCWLWGNYTTPVGDFTLVPVFTPPPTPTPFVSFQVSYKDKDCGMGSCWLWFQIQNNGTLDLESVKVFAKNTSTSNQATSQDNLFQTGIMGSDIASITVGSTGYTHSGQLINPGGATVKANITVCSKNGLGGICLTKNLTVTP
jgi:hypothetical protein